jgi:hypothetical protein
MVWRKSKLIIISVQELYITLNIVMFIQFHLTPSNENVGSVQETPLKPGRCMKAPISNYDTIYIYPTPLEIQDF